MCQLLRVASMLEDRPLLKQRSSSIGSHKLSHFCQPHESPPISSMFVAIFVAFSPPTHYSSEICEKFQLCQHSMMTHLRIYHKEYCFIDDVRKKNARPTHFLIKCRFTKRLHHWVFESPSSFYIRRHMMNSLHCQFP